MAEQAARPPLSKVSLIFACGTALVSDGYSNGVIGSVNTILTNIYGTAFLKQHNRSRVLSSLAFAGTVVGMTTFGYISDKVGRKFGMLTATGLIALFSFLAACSQGAGGSVTGLFAALSAFRFLVGIGIGAEYPCGSVAASEQSEEKGISKHAQNRWLSLATNSSIDMGFVLASFVPLVMYWIFGPHHLAAVWRGSLGFGVILAIGVFIWRWRMEEPTRFKTDSMKYATVPYLLILKRYGWRLAAISAIWFIYDFIVYPFGLFSSTVLDSIIGDNDSLAVVLGWNVVINLFYMPGTVLGAFIIDYLGPKYTLILGLLSQAVFGFIMSGLYPHLKHNVAGFAVIYGIFLSFGELGPGNCTFILASKSSPTAVRGQFFGIAAAIGKVGAFVGTWAFPPMIDAFGGPDSDRGNSGPFFVGSGLAVFSAILTFLFIPTLTADGMAKEDADFREYLTRNGYDVSKMGLPGYTESDFDVPTTEVKQSVDLEEKSSS